MSYKKSSSSTQRVIVLTSPKAGSGAKREEIPRLMTLLDQAGVKATLTVNVADLLNVHNNTIIVAAGGDGTMTLAASHLLGRAIPIVPLPLGTENLLARHFGYRADAKQVVDTIIHGVPHAIDLGEIAATRTSQSEKPMRTIPMLTMATCGFDAEVVRHLHLRRKGHIRRISYLRPIAEVIRRYQFPPITIETLSDDGAIEQVTECGWAMVFNLPCYGGGLTIEPDAVGDDGLLDVIAFKGRNVTSGLRYVAGIKTGHHLGSPDTIRFRARKIRVRSDQRVHFQVDGDYGGRLPIEIGIRPDAVQLLLPKSIPSSGCDM